jgi:hypothetical protein
MPTLLWRVLHDVGYLEGQEPVYSWSESQLAEDRLAVVEITVPALGDAPSGMVGTWSLRDALRLRVQREQLSVSSRTL